MGLQFEGSYNKSSQNKEASVYVNSHMCEERDSNHRTELSNGAPFRMSGSGDLMEF